jgi:His-Xaa-Ser system radical SAM maturase HxsB
METWPLRFRPVGNSILFSDEAGGWFRATDTFLERYASGRLSGADSQFLLGGGHAFEREGDLHHTSFLNRWSRRHTLRAASIDYVILVPTLRCNLACDYCQVSRAAENAKGYDWDASTLARTLAFLDALPTDTIKIEFQGGEPLLRLDLLDAVRSFCRQRFKTAQFVVCSNFQRVSLEAWQFFDAADTSLSTSIDGPREVQSRQRTHDHGAAELFFDNVTEFVARFGNARISALPTIDVNNPPDLGQLIATYERLGLNSIYLRPINRQGFARRQPQRTDQATVWHKLYGEFLDLLIERNFGSERIFEEYYFSHVLRRVLRSGSDRHVDIRNPNPVAADYVVIDHDGTIFPTDEARMMARVGQINLSIGNVASGLDREKIDQLNASCFNDLDPDCQHCAYQPYCGTDQIDSVSRHGRVDVPRPETWFCQRHLGLFDKIFELLTSADPKVQYSMSRWAGVTTWPKHLTEVYS